VANADGYPASGPGYTGTQGLTQVPNGAFQPDRLGVSQASLFRNTTFPYGSLVTLPDVGPSVRSESITGDFKLNLPNFSGGLPWAQRGFEPQDADLKIGPLYLKLRALEAAVLSSDNINLTPDHRESDTIAYVGATIEAVAQLTEGLSITTAGTFVYLPTEGKAGIAGFGLSDIYDFGWLSGPLVRAQVQWQTMIGGWNVVFADDFEIQHALYSDDFRSNDVLFQGADFNNQQVAGRYILRPDRNFIFDNAGANNNDNHNRNLRDDTLVYSNTVSVGTERLLPGAIRLSANVYHENLWYNQGTRGQPALRDAATVVLQDVNENTRFKPYFIYQAFSTDEFDSLQHIFLLGFRGPITDQLQLWAEGGYFTGGFSSNDNGALWRIQLDHTAGPYTQESVFYSREFNYFHDEIDDIFGYNLHQILGPKLDSDFYAYQTRAEYLFHDGTLTDEQWRLGLRFTYAVGPKTTLRLTGEYDTGEFDNTVAWMGRAEVGYNFSDTLLLQLLYQYQQSKSDSFSRNYSENLIYVSLTKYFR